MIDLLIRAGTMWNGTMSKKKLLYRKSTKIPMLNLEKMNKVNHAVLNLNFNLYIVYISVEECSPQYGMTLVLVVSCASVLE